MEQTNFIILLCLKKELKEEIKQSKKPYREVAATWYPYYSGNGLTVMKHLLISFMNISFFRTEGQMGKIFIITRIKRNQGI